MLTMFEDPVTIAGSAESQKARCLARLATDFDVPPFVYLTSSTSDQHVSAQSHQLNAEPLEIDIRRIETLLGKVLAVRSASNVEDSDNASFAGLFHTELGVPVTELKRALLTVLASGSGYAIRRY